MIRRRLLPPLATRQLPGLLAAVLLAGLLPSLAATSARAAEGDSRGRVADRILAVVDEDPILASDLQRAVGLGLFVRQEGEEEDSFHRRLLDGLIEERLRFHEVDRFGFDQVPAAEIDAQVEAIQERFGGAEPFNLRLRKLGMDRTALREVLARQLMILAYVDERLGARVFVSLADIQKYYESELAPQMRARQLEPPPMATVREDIRTLLRERRLNEEIEGWTQELRERADVLDYLDTEHDSLPPLLATF